MIMILSIEGGFHKNVGNEVLVPDRTLAADAVRTFRALLWYRLRKPMPANGAGTTANQSVI
jgi:hypothetical protein